MKNLRNSFVSSEVLVKGGQTVCSLPPQLTNSTMKKIKFALCNFAHFLLQLTIFAFVLTCTDTLDLAVILKALQTAVDAVLVALN